MGKCYSKEIKSEVLKKIREGQRVSDVASAHGIKEATVRSWLVRDTGSSASETLEMSRLRRENRDLTELIGRLTVKSDRLEINQRRGNH